MILNRTKRPRRGPAQPRVSHVLLGLALSTGGVPSQAEEAGEPEWWLPPAEQQASVRVDNRSAGQSLQRQRSVRSFSTTDAPTSVAPVDQASLSMIRGAGTLHFAGSYSDREQVAGGGLTWGPATAYSVVGAGEKYSRTSGQYAGLDPYKYHGGSDTPYRFYGAGVSLAASAATRLLVGFSSVRSDGLEARRASYVEFSSRRFFGRYTHLERGGRSIGHGFDAGIWLGRFKLGYQELETRQEVSTRRVRLQWQAGRHGNLWIDYSRHRNALYQDHEDDVIMVTFQRSLGRGAILPIYADETDLDPGETSTPEDAEGEAAPETGGFKRGYLLAGGAAAALLIASSGSSSQDEAPRVNGQHEAARAALNLINPLSVRENLEYGAYIYRNPDGTFASTDAQQGTASSVSLPPLRLAVPTGSVGTASWHTHAGPDPRFDNENFSETDLESDRTQGIDGYLGTPAGVFKYHDVPSGQVTVLGRINN